jgi:tetraacyldisaccharide 4'-kinase
VAGIGSPARFFRLLKDQGLEIVERPFPDHYDYTAGDFAGFSGRTVVMTEKDAVKCQALVGDDCWYLPLEIQLEQGFERRLESLMKGLKDG